MVKERVLVTCEHGGNGVPSRYAPLFRGWTRRLKTHRGFDPGALQMAEDLSRAFAAPLVASTVTRLLVDLNRSVGNPALHSAAVRRVSREEKSRIVRDHYLPYRRRVEGLVAKAALRGRPVIHIASHTFTPRLDGNVRRADIGLLYDPVRPGERRFCALWKRALERLAPDLEVRRNYPYAGKNDGLTSYLRSRHPPASYVGIEIEINQAFVFRAGPRWTRLRKAVVESLRSTLPALRDG